MIGRQSGQMSMITLDLSELIPENHFHLFRKINQMILYSILLETHSSNSEKILFMSEINRLLFFECTP